MANSSPVLKPVAEQCWTLLGRRQGRVWCCRRVRRTRGEPASVRFDGAWVLNREETRGDVVGFLHTHPEGPSVPSQRDVRTMRAWCGSFGKPLLCLIASPADLCGYCFDDNKSVGQALEMVELFPRGLVIGVDASG